MSKLPGGHGAKSSPLAFSNGSSESQTSGMCSPTPPKTLSEGDYTARILATHKLIDKISTQYVQILTLTRSDSLKADILAFSRDTKDPASRAFELFVTLGHLLIESYCEQWLALDRKLSLLEEGWWAIGGVLEGFEKEFAGFEGMLGRVGRWIEEVEGAMREAVEEAECGQVKVDVFVRGSK